MTSVDHGCDRCLDLADLEASGAELPPEDAAFLDGHREACPVCALASKLTSRMHDLDGPGPAPHLDQAERRRWIEEALGCADAVPGESARAESRRPARRLPAALWTAAAVAAAAGLAVVVGVLWSRSGSAPAPAERIPPPRVFLTVGDVTGSAGTVVAGTLLLAGVTLDVTDGRAGIRLCGDAALFLGPGSRLRIGGDEPAPCRVFLESGHLVAVVSRLPPGARLAVASPAGTVEVAGTIFAVEVIDGDVDVRVLRGAVLATGSAGGVRKLAALQAARLAAGPARRLRMDEMARDRALAEWPESVTDREAAVAEFNSIPPGADVFIDGTRLGTTPLTALVGPGRRLVEVQATGRPPVREFVLLESGERISRRFVLAEPLAGEPARSLLASPPGATGTVEPGAPESPGIPPQAADRSAPDADPGRREPPATQASPAEVQRTPSDLLARARRLRLAGDWRGAADAYAQLVERFPNTSEARLALVPLGDLQLEQLGDPAGAMRSYETYLAAGASGPLAEEAAWGRATALRHLGRRAEEAAALREFLASHPSSLTADEAQRRLTELSERRESP